MNWCNPVSLGILLAIVSVTLVYGTDLYVIFEKAANFSAYSVSNYVLVLPFLVLFLIFTKRNIISYHTAQRKIEILSKDGIIGLSIIGLAVFLYFFGSDTFYPLEYHIGSMVVFVAGITVFLFGLKVFRETVFAFALLVFLIPIPTEFIGFLVGGISPLNTVLIHDLLDFFGIPVFTDTISDYSTLTATKSGDVFTWQIAQPSSGIYSMITLASLGFFIANIMKGSWSRQLIVILAGFPILFALNIIRISLVISLWYFFDHDTSELFHVASGSIMIAIGGMVLFVVADKILHLRLQLSKKIKDAQLCSMPLRADLRPRQRLDKKMLNKFALVAIISAVFLIANIQASTATISQPNLENLPKIDLESIEDESAMILLPDIEKWNLQFHHRERDFEENADMNLAVWLKYTGDAGMSPNYPYANPVLFAGVETWDYSHRWESSILWQGREPSKIFAQEDISILEGIDGRFISWQKPNLDTPDAVMYWIKEVPVMSENLVDVKKKYFVFTVWSELSYLEELGLIGSVEDYDAIQELFLSLAIPMAAYWQQNIMVQETQVGLFLAGLEKNSLNPSDEGIIPNWIRIAAKNWVDKGGSNYDLLQGLSYLVNEDLVKAKNTENARYFVSDYPAWKIGLIKEWTDNIISDEEFIREIQILVDSGLITVLPYQEQLENASLSEKSLEQMTREANLLFEKANYFEALRIYEYAIENHQDDINAKIGKANVLTVLGWTQDAIATYNKILEENPNHINSILGKANAMVRLSEFEDARVLYHTVIDLDPKNPHAPKALDWIDQTIADRNQVPRDAPEPQSKQEELWMKAEELFVQKEYDQALEIYNMILHEIDPNYANAMGGIAAVNHRLGNYETALQYYDMAINLEPENVFFQSDKANLLVLMQRYDDALKQYDIVFEINPYQIDSLNGIGNLWARLGDHEKELHYRDLVLRSDHDNLEGLLGKANAYASLGKYDDAIIYYDKVLEINPDNIAVRDHRDRIAGFKN